MSRVADLSQKPSIGRVPRGRRALIPAATAALLLSACGGGGAGSSGDESSVNPNDPRNSPLAQLMGFSGSTADQRAKDLEVQQAVAQCMRDEGWEYEPVDWGAQMGDMNAEWELQLSDPEAYGEKYGYGVVRSYESQGEITTGFEDPNQDYLNSLSPEENEAYYETLYGPQSFSESDDPEEFTMPPLEEQGCNGKGMLAVYGENSPMTNTDVQNRINESYDEILNDPDVVAALDAWSACMRDKEPSYDWETPDEVMSSFWDRMNELQGFGAVSDADDTGAVETASVGVDTGMPEIDEADLDELRQDEIATWRDDWDCQQEADLAEARLQAEQRFVDELLAEFPELEES